MKSFPAELPDWVIDRDHASPGGPSAVADDGLLPRLALWLAEVAAEAALPSARPATDPPLDSARSVLRCR
jgi:hypothetical protein